jgi:glutamate-1-semialdehyde 2,1-aminomutase
MEHNYSDRYRLSLQMLERAIKTIPLGSQTFSKSKTQYPYGVSPYFIKKGKGSRVWDVDGNEYIDFINALAAVTLGYNDPDVTNAVKAQLEEGTIFSLPHELEVKVAEKIVEMVPCAEMVRFGKNGSDVTSGAIRLARACTKREHVAVCGYHGWQDWYIGSTSRNLGVPQSTRDLTHTFAYNNIDSLYKVFQQYPDQIATVIMEPMNVSEPKDNFLEKVKDLTHKNKAVFIFDETITGFRYSTGGAQEYFGVIPDLATFGKGLANGYPVSAVAGKVEIMRLMEEIFFSFTFGGETLSLAAALATMTKLQKEPVIEKLWSQGRKVVDGTKLLIENHRLEDVLSIGGKECWSFLIFKDSDIYSQWELKTLFLQEVFRRGILALGTHNMSYAHTDEDISKLLGIYDEVFAIIKNTIVNRNLNEMLQSEVLVPLFKIR